MYKLLLPFSFAMLLFVGCQKEITVDIPEYDSKLVVEGYIENGEYPMVLLTKSVPYFSTVDIDYLIKNVLVSNAVVTVTTSTGESEQLTLQYNENSPFYLAYTGKKIKGMLNTDYYLKIEWNNQVYTSKTSIFNTFDLDSIGFSASADLLTDTMRTIRLLFTDNPAETNYYQFFVKVHGKNLHDRLWITTMPVAFDDITFSGLTLNFEVLRANPSALLMPEMSEEALASYYRMTYRPGDTVYVKHSQIDYDGYQFWVTGGNDMAFGQNPFMTPTTVKSNIKGENVLGVWCGYATKIDTLYYK